MTMRSCPWSALFLLCSASSFGAAPLKAMVSIDTSAPLASPNEQPSFLGFNIDAASLYEGDRDGRPHRLDVTDPGLFDLTSRLCRSSPHGSILRIGGSAADDLAYLRKGTFAEQFPNQSIHVDHAYFNNITSFAERSGCRLIWDVNALTFRNSDGTWNSSNAEALLRDAVDAGQQIYGLQLGNEAGHWWTRHHHNGPWGDQLGKDFVALKQLLTRIYKDSNLAMPKLFGPDVCAGQMSNASPCSNITFFRDFLKAAGEVIDGVTLHDYGLLRFKPPSDCSLSHYMNPDLIYDYELENLKVWRDAQRAEAPKAQMILGETASSADGGCVGLANSFAAGFFNIHRLSSAAAIGYDGVFRQDLVGWSGIGTKSSYALAGPPGWVGGSDSVPLLPHPDYFSSLLFKQLVGGVHLTAKYQGSWPKELSLHAACTSSNEQPDGDHRCGDLTLMYSNVASTAIAIADTQISFGARNEYFLSSEAGNLTSQSIFLNNGRRALQADDRMMGRLIQDGSTLVLPAQTYGFVVLPVSSSKTRGLCRCSEARESFPPAFV